MAANGGEERRISCERSSSEASSFVAERLPHTNNVIRGQDHAYSVGRKVASGRFGAVFEVLRRGDGRHFAAKLEVCDSHFHGLHMDYTVLRAANKARLAHFAELLDRGKIEGHFKFMLGPNLDKLRQEFQANRFSAPTALRLGLEMITALEELHSLGFVHRDVKPSNFVMNREGAEWKLYMIDFGLCRQFRHSDGSLKSAREKAQFRGTQRYASLAAHREQEQAPKDDLESWLYVLVELLTGQLPWAGLGKRERDACRLAKEAARSAEGAHQLLEYCPRTEFRRVMKYVDGLGFGGQPDYAFLRQLVQLAMKNNDIRPDQPYDWELEPGGAAGDDSDPERARSDSDLSEQPPGNSVVDKLARVVQQINGKSLSVDQD